MNINRLFVFSFKNGNDDPTRYFMSLVEIKAFNVLVDNQSFLDQPVKTSKNRMKNLLKCQEVKTIQQKIYWIICIIKNIINSLV